MAIVVSEASQLFRAALWREERRQSLTFIAFKFEFFLTKCSRVIFNSLFSSASLADLCSIGAVHLHERGQTTGEHKGRALVAHCSRPLLEVRRIRTETNERRLRATSQISSPFREGPRGSL